MTSGLLSLRPVLAILLLGSTGACALEEIGPKAEDPTTEDGPARIPSDDPAVDERLDQLEIVCQSTLLVSGTYDVTTPRPGDVMGCWPVGMWALTLSVDFQGCDPQPALSGEYAYEVTRDDDSNSSVVFLGDPDNERLSLKVTTAGDGLCHGNFDHFELDNSVLSLKPTVLEDGTIEGEGTYSVHLFDPF